MLSKISRYRKLSDEVTQDAKRQTRITAKGTRPLPETSGTFRHTVAAGDRLDQLAYTYYQQPRKWWRICDANPEFLSPQAMLGQEPWMTALFKLVFNTTPPAPPSSAPWAALIQTLRAQVGVAEVNLSEQITSIVKSSVVVNNETVLVYGDHIETTLAVTFNALNVKTSELAKTMTDAGFVVSTPEQLSRVGKPIVIPPDVAG